MDRPDRAGKRPALRKGKGEKGVLLGGERSAAAETGGTPFSFEGGGEDLPGDWGRARGRKEERSCFLGISTMRGSHGPPTPVSFLLKGALSLVERRGGGGNNFPRGDQSSVMDRKGNSAFESRKERDPPRGLKSPAFLTPAQGKKGCSEVDRSLLKAGKKPKQLIARKRASVWEKGMSAVFTTRPRKKEERKPREERASPKRAYSLGGGKPQGCCGEKRKRSGDAPGKEGGAGRPR